MEVYTLAQYSLMSKIEFYKKEEIELYRNIQS